LSSIHSRRETKRLVRRKRDREGEYARRTMRGRRKDSPREGDDTTRRGGNTRTADRQPMGTTHQSGRDGRCPKQHGAPAEARRQDSSVFVFTTTSAPRGGRAGASGRRSRDAGGKEQWMTTTGTRRT